MDVIHARQKNKLRSVAHFTLRMMLYKVFMSIQTPRTRGW